VQFEWDTGPAEALDHTDGPPESHPADVRRRRPGGTATVLVVALALLVAFHLGRLDAARSPTPAQHAAATPRSARACPVGDRCKTEALSVPGLAGLLRSEFPDVAATRVVATVVNGRERQVELAASLARGDVVRVVASDLRTAPTPWTFVAVGDLSHPDHVQRVLVDPYGSSAVARVEVWVDRVQSSVQRPGLSDFRCAWCGGSGRSVGGTAALAQVLDRASSPLVAMLATAVVATAHSRALTWLAG
jgi:hypothetical protein